MKTTQKTIALLLTALTPASLLLSCGDTQPIDPGNVTTASGSEETTALVGYDYGGRDYDGYEFRVLNFESIWSTYIHLDFAEQSGERLDDAVYDRNRKVEDALNFKFVEEEVVYAGWGTGQNAILDLVTQAVMAGDYSYDAAYLPVSFKPGIVTDGYLYDLNELPGLNLDEDYWDKALNESLELNGHLYTASSPLNLMSFDMADVLLFNQDLFDDNKLEYPYQLVRDGKWTLDKMYEYVTAVTSLNGDESFAINANGNAVYGIASHNDIPFAMTYSAGFTISDKTDKGITLNIEDERLYNIVEKLGKMWDKEAGHAIIGTDANQPNYYLGLFSSGRAGFITCELKMSLELRDMEDTFGLIPMPKYDESQEEYRTMTGYSACLLTVPKIQQNSERTGVILDALSYESNESVLPVYFDVTVSQKGLLNEESIEMLEIIRSGRAAEYTRIYGISNTYVTKLLNLITTGSTDTASLAASQKASMEESIQKVLDALQ
ncbi:MAG: extracellular solute-binding protein [Clostridia bacterium]|nr:extracellular solute-binding protein [Clostridia bacterium]